MKPSTIMLLVCGLAFLMQDRVVGQQGGIWHFQIAEDGERSQTETSVAIHPENPDVLMVSYSDRQGVASGPWRAAFAFSTDGGVTWSTDLIDAGQGPIEAYNSSCVINRDGSAVQAFIGHGTGRGPLVAAYSSNLGLQWDTTVVDGSNMDKPYLTGDFTGSERDGWLYVAYSRAGTTEEEAADRVWLAYSEDNGETFAQPLLLDETISLKPQGAVPIVGKNGRVLVAYVRVADASPTGARLTVAHSDEPDNPSSFSITEYDQYADVENSSLSSALWFLRFPSAAADPVSGYAYIAYLKWDPSLSRFGIAVLVSTNNGDSFDSPYFLVDELGGNLAYPWITVDPSGKVLLYFVHAFEDGGMKYADVYVAESYDRGFLWSLRKITDNPIDVTSPSGGPRAPDYDGITARLGIVYPVWSNLVSNEREESRMDIYGARAYSKPTSSVGFATSSGQSRKTVYNSSDGKWHCVYMSNNALWHIWSTNSGTLWQGFDKVNGAPELGEQSNPSLSRTSDGKLHTVFSTKNGLFVYYARTNSSGVWEAPVQLAQPGVLATHGVASLVTSGSTGHVAYVRLMEIIEGEEVSFSYELRHGTFDASSSTPQLGATTLVHVSSTPISRPAIDIAGDGKPHVVWEEGEVVYHALQNGTSWSNSTVSNSQYAADAPSIYLGGTTAHIAWQEYRSGKWEIWYRIRASNGTWGNAQKVSGSEGNAIRPQISGPVGNDPLVVYAGESGGTYDIRYNWLRSSGGFAPGSFKTTDLQSQHPVFGLKSTGATEVQALAMWTDGTQNPFLVESDVKLFNLTSTQGGGGGPVLKTTTPGVPETYALHQNYPNPFNPTTLIHFDLPDHGLVMLEVFDLLGRQVAVVLNQIISAGYYGVEFDASNLPSGVYFYRLQGSPENAQIGKFEAVRKMIFIR